MDYSAALFLFWRDPAGSYGKTGRGENVFRGGGGGDSALERRRANKKGETGSRGDRSPAVVVWGHGLASKMGKERKNLDRDAATRIF